MFRFPGSGPDFQTLLDDLPTRDPARIARYLGVSARTLRRWKATGNPPRLVYLALFWETRWGVETINCHAINDARTAYGLARALEDQLRQLRGRIALLEGLADFGSANAPYWRDANNAPPADTAPAGVEMDWVVKEPEAPVTAISRGADCGLSVAIGPASWR